tara:strand:+ start:369 stop:638 length:270 start_codon:yes stop_codon:yes gene_type:complete
VNIAWVFPGQGSQFVGMGKDIFNNSKIAKNYFQKANKILGYDIKSIILNGPDKTLKKNYIHPTIDLYLKRYHWKNFINKRKYTIGCCRA